MQAILSRYPAIGQFLRFGVIGAMNTGVDLVILNILMFISGYTDGTPYSIFKTISFAAAATFSYFMNKRWAFRDKSKNQEVKKFSQFFVISIIGALINVTVASLVVNFAKPALDSTLIIPLSAQIWGSVGALCGTAVGLAWNFLGYKFIVFKK